jgi:beta-N-acetylhexosaminidase
MTSHVSFPHIFGPMPATLNPQISRELLREKLGFQGVLISDDLRMNAISSILGYDKKVESSITESSFSHVENSYEYLKEASLLALQSGIDVLLPCKNLEEDLIVFETIEQKIKDSHPSDFLTNLSHFQHTKFYQ